MVQNIIKVMEVIYILKKVLEKGGIQKVQEILVVVTIQKVGTSRKVPVIIPIIHIHRTVEKMIQNLIKATNLIKAHIVNPIDHLVEAKLKKM
jgi:hypothetical protein